jgi:bifunctional non-homologous end joining protein LigD
MKSVSLYYREGTSDKEYHIQLEQANGGYVVNFQYGRRGSALKSGTKTLVPVSIGAANQIYDKLLREKTGKGYVEGQSGGQGFRQR